MMTKIINYLKRIFNRPPKIEVEKRPRLDTIIEMSSEEFAEEINRRLEENGGF